MGREIPPFKMAFSQKNLVKLQALLPRYENCISLQRQTARSQQSGSKEYQDITRKTRTYISHFLRVMNMAVQRGDLPAETRSCYSIPVDDPTLPSMAGENELITWGKRVIEGEEYRKKRGWTPVTNPSIALVKVWYEKFLDASHYNSTLGRRSADHACEIAGLRKEADTLIQNIWNEVENSFSDICDSDRRAECEKYGVVYVLRKGEKLTG